MRGLELFAGITTIVGIYFITVFAFANLIDDWNFYRGFKKRWRIQLVKNLLAVIVMSLFSTALTAALVLDIRHPENKVKNLRNRVENAQIQLDNYLKEHPEYKESEE